MNFESAFFFKVSLTEMWYVILNNGTLATGFVTIRGHINESFDIFVLLILGVHAL